ncbi:MAG TPA: hypothetical protein VJ746_20195 [Nitrospira sp.]|nr:hypothetical protein [Nitrospira sp.]
MILILADSTDPWATLLNREVRRRGGDVVWVEPSQLLDRISLTWPVSMRTDHVRGSVTIDGAVLPFEELTGVFSRFIMPLPLVLEDLSAQDRDYVIKESGAAWLAFLNGLSCAVVNRPVPGGRATVPAGSRQLASLVRQHGYVLPPARFTTNQTDALSQYSTWNEQVYLKPIGSQEAGQFVSSPDGAEKISRVMERQAVSLQAVPRGRRVTVYVAGERAVATVMQAGDRRESNIDIRLPDGQRCAALVLDMGLNFAECELVVCSDGRTYCLDINAMPDFWRCPAEIQRRVVSTLSEYLSERRSVPFHDPVDRPHGGSGAGERLCQARSPER